MTLAGRQWKGSGRAAAMLPALVAACASLVVAYALKRHYSLAGASDLRWILAPTTSIVSAVLGETFLWEPDVGFVSTRLGVAITPACAGVNFLVIALVTTTLGAAPTLRSRWGVFVALVACAAASYLLTLAVNATRIVVACAVHREHRTEGVVLYLAATCFAYAVAQHTSRRWTCTHCA